MRYVVMLYCSQFWVLTATGSPLNGLQISAKNLEAVMATYNLIEPQHEAEIREICLGDLYTIIGEWIKVQVHRAYQP